MDYAKLSKRVLQCRCEQSRETWLTQTSALLSRCSDMGRPRETCDGRRRSSVVVVVAVVKEELKRPRQVDGRGTTRSNVHLSLGTSGCRNLGRLNLRQLPLPHHCRTQSLLLLLPLYTVGSRHRHRCVDRHFRHYRNARRHEATRHVALSDVV